MASTPTKQNCLTLSEKSKILEELSKGEAVTFLARKYGVAKSTICGIRNKKKQILIALSNTLDPATKKRTLKRPELPKMEQELYNWVLQQRKEHLPISGELLKDKAKSLHEIFQENGGVFKASDGWLQRFKKRYGVRFFKITKEMIFSQPEFDDPFELKLQAKYAEMHLVPHQIYNAEAIELYCNFIPDETYLGPKKPNKQRLTFLACSNVSGVHKIKPLAIVKSQILSSLANLMDTQVEITSSKTAFMTPDIFKHWFQHLFIAQAKLFLSDNNLSHKAILLLDNAPCQLPESELNSENGNFIAIYMPPNIKSLSQPLEQNVIKKSKNLTLRDAVIKLAETWNDLKPNVIRKCCRSILSQYDEGSDYDENNFSMGISIVQNRDFAIGTPTVISENSPIGFSNVKRETEGEVEMQEEVKVESAIDYDRESRTEDIFSEDNVTSNNSITLNVKEEKNAVSPSEAVEAFNQTIQWAEENDVTYSDMLVLQKLRDIAVKMSFNQT